MIGDGPSYYNNPQDPSDDDELPGVMLPESDGKIPGVDIPEEYVEITGVDNAQDEPDAIIDSGVGLDDIASTPIEEFPMVEELEVLPENVPTVPPTFQSPPKARKEVQPMQVVDNGPQRSNRVRIQPTNYVPSHQGKKYSFAVTQLGQELI